MTALQQAKALHVKYGLNFEELLCWYLENGLVFVAPDRFLMAREINAARGDVDWHAKDADCYYVQCAVGNGCLPWFLSNAPKQMPFLAWNRRFGRGNRLMVYNAERFKRLIKT